MSAAKEASYFAYDERPVIAPLPQNVYHRHTHIYDYGEYVDQYSHWRGEAAV